MAEPKSLTPHQRISLGIIVVVGITTFVFGLFRLKKTIFLPYLRDTSFTYKTLEQLEEERNQQLRTQDTDRDGITDYDELYVFRTSPFLEDSDSDGIDDGKEIAGGTDPNCPAGRTCRQARVSSDAPGPLTVPGIGAGDRPTHVSEQEARILEMMEKTFGTTTDLTMEDVGKRLMEMSTDELREFLLAMGVPGEALEQADDATLRQLIEETFSEVVQTDGGEGRQGQ